MNDFSIDLETLGRRYSAAIISIGVQQFDRDTGKMGATFYEEIDLDSALKSGTLNGDTILFWMQQNRAAQRVFHTPPEKKVGLATALDHLTSWMRGLSVAPRVWGNGATFDITILEHAYDVGCVGLREPWHFRNVRDMRTLLEVSPISWDAIKFVGTPHHALHDATHQAKVISAAWRQSAALRKTKPTTTTEDEEL